MNRRIIKIESGKAGLWFVLSEEGRLHREWVSNRRIKETGVILIFADKTIDGDKEDWGLIDINLWLRGFGSVL